MELDFVWKSCFTAWPEDLPRRGVLVTTFGEQILFSNFLTSETLLLVERHAPDQMGARQLFVPYQNISAVKITEVVKEKAFRAFGFEGKLSGK